MNNEQISANEREVDNLIKYKAVFDTSSFFITLGIYISVVSVILLIIGPLIGGNIGGLLVGVGQFAIVLGPIILIIAFPIKSINKPKYEDAKSRTQFDSVNTPEITKNSLFSYIRNNRHDGKSGRIDSAIKLIADVSGENDIDVIVSILEDQTYDEEVRSAAVSYLGKPDDERVLDPLIKALQSNYTEEIRAKAAFSLQRTNNNKAVEPLTQALNDENRSVRKAAKESLKSLRQRL